MVKKNMTELGELIKEINTVETNDKQTYHNANLLLNIYSSAVWNTRETVDNLLYEHSEAYASNDISGLHSLVSMYENKDTRQIEEKLRCVAHNKLIIDLVERCVLHVRDYPRYGNLYYEILNKNFFVKYPYTEAEITDALSLSRSTYYRRRKEAITTFGISLWGYVLPNVLTALKNNLLTNNHNETFMRQN